ncbi:MAG: hypothetical protein H3C64_09690 [Candidatus Kuenenia stuttgartiensis]|jgi:hypothetical protein|uniref:Uncharacterized protein n=2 Tax=Kuenenia stuttgartiensis TaxID=174633 RepID=Q1PZ39_KUEST|nr:MULTISPECIES: hypothetical protein [Kuenenia]MBE7547391.1 hypothetical protein [Planctomycetia bacterium]MBW7942641.1 hypothetical protein [Candidatus Kuenenia stuttgartiensis]MBZ0190616.1 hypothetical protein [Candidatus Kuenenia stuttgartiensis]MCF6151797.1 hypothetical protein [Candidatus Kuenenia stuttgartiensis]MCL4726349.1 hypothetical protein [Candidatus Kuenenia stuttgartiensis]
MEEIMGTRAEYEKIILREVREMPGEVLPKVVKIIHSLKEGVLSVKVRHKKRETKGSGLYGIWNDERSAAEIIKDIRLHREGFGGRALNPMDREFEDYQVE